jgi:hypothetical protein
LEPFTVKDCALIAIATGKKAQNLKELRDGLLSVPLDCIYYHFWGGLLHSRFEEPEYNNDFAAFAAHVLHDQTLAERLAVLDPIHFDTIDALRSELIDLIDARLDEIREPAWVDPENQFHFVRSQIVVFDTNKRFDNPSDLAKFLPQATPSSIFYHFIDARRRVVEGIDDFRLWLQGIDGDWTPLIEALKAIDPYFMPLQSLRDQIAQVFADYCSQEK